MTVSSTTGLASNLQALNAGDSVSSASKQGGLSGLDQGNFLRLLLTQLQQQDPLEPVDNKEMLAQMAQFTALAGSTETNQTLSDISAKLDALIAVQQTAQTSTDDQPTS